MRRKPMDLDDDEDDDEPSVARRLAAGFWPGVMASGKFVFFLGGVVFAWWSVMSGDRASMTAQAVLACFCMLAARVCQAEESRYD